MRVGRLETTVSDIRADVAALKATVAQLATKGEIAELKAELTAQIGDLKAQFSAGEASVIKWLVGTVISCAALAFAAGKLIA